MFTCLGGCSISSPIQRLWVYNMHSGQMESIIPQWLEPQGILPKEEEKKEREPQGTVLIEVAAYVDSMDGEGIVYCGCQVFGALFYFIGKLANAVCKHKRVYIHEIP